MLYLIAAILFGAAAFMALRQPSRRPFMDQARRMYRHGPLPPAAEYEARRADQRRIVISLLGGVYMLAKALGW